MESRPDFHCFRHTVRHLMRQAGSPQLYKAQWGIVHNRNS